jgi:uncharacterized protein
VGNLSETEGQAATARAALEAMIRYNGGDPRRIHHALKVHSFARMIASAEGCRGPILETIEVAAALHDIGIHAAESKYGSSAGNYQELEGPGIARELLAGTGIDPGIEERVLYLIGHHHSYGAIDGLDFQILVEADFLVNAFEDAMGREAVEAVRRKIFKTASGAALLESMYLPGPAAVSISDLRRV